MHLKYKCTLFIKCEWFIGFDYYIVGLVLSMFWEVSNYSSQAMEKTNFCLLLFVGFLSSFCYSNDYKSYDYKNNEYNYNEYYDYDNQKPEDYTNDYSQDLNDYYDQNLLVPPNPPPPPLRPPPLMGKITLFFYFK